MRKADGVTVQHVDDIARPDGIDTLLILTARFNRWLSELRLALEMSARGAALQ